MRGYRPIEDTVPRLSCVWASAFLDLRRTIGILYFPRYLRQWVAYRSLLDRGQVSLLDSHPCLTDWTSYTPFDSHYFYQAAWAARKLVDRRPILHVDVGSSVLMLSVISGMVPTVFVDYRPLRAKVDSLHSLVGDLTNLPFRSQSIFSLSCLHVIEHVGLGRYGDPLDPDGSVKASLELARVLGVGGVLLLSTPVGRERVCFNAHRVFAPSTVLRMFDPLDLLSFALVDDAGQYYPTTELEQAAENEYACGMFEFVRNPS